MNTTSHIDIKAKIEAIAGVTVGLLLAHGIGDIIYSIIDDIVMPNIEPQLKTVYEKYTDGSEGLKIGRFVFNIENLIAALIKFVVLVLIVMVIMQLTKNSTGKSPVVQLVRIVT